MSDAIVDTDRINELHAAEQAISAQEDTDAVYRLRKAARDVVESAGGPMVYIELRDEGPDS